MVETETQAADCVNAGIRMKKDLGFLHLGKIDQEYIQDPDLSKILEKTVLDSNKTGVFEGQQLRLITSVIYIYIYIYIYEKLDLLTFTHEQI